METHIAENNGHLEGPRAAYAKREVFPATYKRLVTEAAWADLRTYPPTLLLLLKYLKRKWRNLLRQGSAQVGAAPV